MSKHFEDARYYLTRAAEHAKEGLKEEVRPLENRVRELVGKEKDPEPSRLEKLQRELKELEEKAEGETKRAVGDARERIRRYREDRAGE